MAPGGDPGRARAREPVGLEASGQDDPKAAVGIGCAPGRRGAHLQQAYGVAPAMERVIERARKAAEMTEREAVAEEVRGLIRDSKLSRTEFASLIGTSPSRLSTYASGKVTPSAALLVRMRNAATGN